MLRFVYSEAVESKHIKLETSCTRLKVDNTQGRGKDHYTASLQCN